MSSTRMKFLFVALIFYGLYKGNQFLFSPEFQAYADKTKAPWTCHVNLFLGGIYDIGSNYQAAYNVYDKITTRCPETPMASDGLFFKAAALESLYRPSEAFVLYQEYVDTFPEGERRISALRSLDRIRLSR
jgi:hypothetical protein